MVLDLVTFILVVIGGVMLLFLLTYLTLQTRKGIFYEIFSQRKHPYRFTLWMAAGQSGGWTAAYLIQHYFTPSPLETIGYLVFGLFLLITFIAIVFGVRLWNLEKKQSQGVAKA